MPTGTIGSNTLFGYKVEAHGKFAAVGNPNRQYQNQHGSGSIDVYRYDASKGAYSYYGTSQSIKANGSSGTSGNGSAGTAGSSATVVADSYGLSFALHNNIFIVGDPFFSGSYDGNPYSHKSLVDVYVLNDTSSVSSTLGQTMYSVRKINSPISTSNDSFGTSVSVNSKYIVVGANEEGGSQEGGIYIYSYTTGSVFSYSLVQHILGDVAGKFFGSQVKIDHSGTDNILIAESSSLENPNVFIYESSSAGWNKTHVFSSITGSKNVPFDQFESYNYVKNPYDQFGKSISIDGRTIVIGAPFDSSYYEYSGSSTQYSKGAVYIYGRTDCPSDYTFTTNTTSSVYNDISESYWDLEEKYIGDENSIKGNQLGCSVGVYDEKIIAGCISSSYGYTTSSISSSLNESYDDFPVVLGQFVYFERSGSLINTVTYDNKKKQYRYPYLTYGYDVAISEKAILMGTPFILTDATSSNTFTLPIQQSDLVNVKGHVYISSLDSLRTDYHAGNVFYRNGEIVFSNTGSQFTNMLKTNDTQEFKYDLNYRGYYTLNEKSIICTVSPGEFNVSTNYTALDLVDPIFDLHGSGEFTFRDINLILLYIVDINTPGSPNFATDDTFWDEYVIETQTERSLFEYYKNKYGYGRYTLKVEYQQYITALRSLESKFDFDGDGKITINDAKILWKNFVSGLETDSYQRLINPFSTRKTLSDVVAYLTTLTSKYANTYGVPTQRSVFSEYGYSSSLDVTGSYLAPYVTTIGLYSGTDLVAVAKLSSPVKNSGEYPLNFLIKWDV